MQYTISKTNFNQMMALIDKAVVIIKAGKPSNRDYNVARRLSMVKRQVERNAKSTEHT